MQSKTNHTNTKSVVDDQVIEKIRKYNRRNSICFKIAILGWTTFLVMTIVFDKISPGWYNNLNTIYGYSWIIVLGISGIVSADAISDATGGFRKVIPSMNARQVEDLRTIIRKHFRKYNIPTEQFEKYFTRNSLEDVKTKEDLRYFFVKRYAEVKRENSHIFDNITTAEYDQIVNEIVYEFIDKYSMIYGAVWYLLG